MSFFVPQLGHEPSLTPAAALAAKISRLLLMAVCVGPIAVFPIGLAYKGYAHFFGGASTVAGSVAAPLPRH